MEERERKQKNKMEEKHLNFSLDFKKLYFNVIKINACYEKKKKLAC